MVNVVCIVVCFFKQKTAYEMRISDWSSDVCSSDLEALARVEARVAMRVVAIGEALLGHRHRAAGAFGDVLPRHLGVDAARDRALGAMHREEAAYLGQEPVERPRLRSEARRVGEEGVGKFRPRVRQYS